MKIDLKQYQKINRREALLLLQKGEKVVCQIFSQKSERISLEIQKSEDFQTISSMAELQKLVLNEQRGLYNKLEFYKKN